tara:strand:+ start:504 stop:1052 length:549 start_codon:yes stop_codon:yes gene_type:complete
MSFGDLHPFFVHFPIAFFILIFIIEGIRLFTNRIHPMVSLIILFLGTILAFLAVQSGEVESLESLKEVDDNFGQLYSQLDTTEDSYYDKGMRSLENKIEEHERAGNRVMWGSIIIFFIWLFLYLKSKDSMNYKYFKIGLISILMALVLVSAISGGDLVRENGLGTPTPDFDSKPGTTFMQSS